MAENRGSPRRLRRSGRCRCPRPSQRGGPSGLLGRERLSPLRRAKRLAAALTALHRMKGGPAPIEASSRKRKQHRKKRLSLLRGAKQLAAGLTARRLTTTGGALKIRNVRWCLSERGRGCSSF